MVDLKAERTDFCRGGVLYSDSRRMPQNIPQRIPYVYAAALALYLTFSAERHREKKEREGD